MVLMSDLESSRRSLMEYTPFLTRLRGGARRRALCTTAHGHSMAARYLYIRLCWMLELAALLFGGRPVLSAVGAVAEDAKRTRRPLLQPAWMAILSAVLSCAKATTRTELRVGLYGSLNRFFYPARMMM